MLILAALLAIAAPVFATARSFTGAAAVGKAEVKAGAASLGSHDATAAASHFKTASAAFVSAKRALGPDWVASSMARLPWAGRQYSTARSLVAIGLDGATGGQELAEALRAKSAGSQTGESALFGPGRVHLETGVRLLVAAAKTSSQLSTEGLVPPLRKAVLSIDEALAPAKPLLARADAFLQLESYLFSSEHRLLVVSQDGAELRPTGGFIGSFGVITVGPHGFTLDRYEDITRLPDPPGIVKPPSGAIMTKDFALRDANWWIDFPTSARWILGFWKLYRQPPVDGVVAIDTVAMKELLAETGPVTVPGYNETFTSANLLDRLLYLIEIDVEVGNRKGVLVALAEEVERRIVSSDSNEMLKSAKALAKAADEKHVQLYFPDPAAERAVTAAGWSGAVTLPPATTDLLAVCNAMNRGGKVNIATTKTIDYEVAIRPDHSADTTASLYLANTGPYPDTAHMPSIFRDWQRVYRAPGTVFPPRTPAGTRTVTIEEFGLPGEVRTFSMPRKAVRKDSFVSRVPNAIVPENASPGGGGLWHYRLRLIRQTDLANIPTTITVTAPPGWRISGATAQLTASRAILPVVVGPNLARIGFPQYGDLDLDVRLTSP